MKSLLYGDVLEEGVELSMGELCHAAQVPAEVIIEMVEQGIIDPLDRDPGRWRFSVVSIHRVRCAQRLRRDLGVNLPGAALAIELLEELEQLRTRLRYLDN